MSDEKQAPPPAEAPAPGAEAPGPASSRAAGGLAQPAGPPAGAAASHPAFESLEGGAGPPAAPGRLEPAPPPLPRRVLHAAFALALVGLVALALGQVEAALLTAIAAFYFVAQGADVHPAMRQVYALLAWIPPVLGAVALGALARTLVVDAPLTAPRIAFAAFAALGALASLATLAPSFTDRLVRALFRGAGPSNTLRLTATAVMVTLWVGLPAWLAFRDQLADLLKDPGALVTPQKLSGGLVGYVLLAFAGVGCLVRRGWRESLARLGLTAPRPADALVLVAGVVALWLFNAGSEALERSAYPALWAADQGFTTALAGVMGPGLMVLLGLSAGIGEEITLRGALQPKLGIVPTSLLFAALHVQYSWYGMLSILGFGLILGTIRRRSSTTTAILVHALYDLLAVATARG